MEADVKEQVQNVLSEQGLSERQVNALASQLVWRVGRTDDGPVTVRLGLATSANLFADLPRLRAASDAELAAAVAARNIRVEWVGQGLAP